MKDRQTERKKDRKKKDRQTERKKRKSKYVTTKT